MILLSLLLFVNALDMTVEEKVGQVLMPHFHGDAANRDAEILIQDLHVGGIIYYAWANDLACKEQVKALSSGLQNLAKLPLLLAVDQEGGRVARIKEMTPTIGNGALGALGDPEEARKAALITGLELKGLGIQLNLAPVVDVNSNPLNQVIGDRSFGSSSKQVALFGEKALEGYHAAGILTCLKHFPGHGDVEVDSHLELPVLRKSLVELQKVELFPFAKLASNTDAIMTAHILTPALDPKWCATLSKKTLDYLRDTIGFEGVIISDSLVMQGVLKSLPSIEAIALQAFNAGCDILLLGGRGKHVIDHQSDWGELTIDDVKKIHASLVSAVKAGHISEERLNQSVQRILKLKKV